MHILKKIFKILLIVVVVLIIAAMIVFQLPQFGGSFGGERLERMQASPQWHDERFENIPPQNTDNSLWSNYKLYSQGQIREPQFEIPVIPVSEESLAAKPAPGLRAIWFGHATVLVEIDGVRIMTDPVLSEVVSPVAPIGPKRFHAPPIPLEKLPGIDAVVITHDHYDHLDMETIKQLSKGGTHFYVGLGIGAHLERWNVPLAQIHEMDWWEVLEVQGVKINCTPARHYSGRKRMDNSTLWTSWFVKGPEHSFYVSGDTGYADHFKAIHDRFGDVDLTAMKVGAYGDTWLDIHMDPEHAVQAHVDLGGKIMLPEHWATFNLSYHAWDEPILRTLKAANENQVKVIAPKVGEVFVFGEEFENSEWWR